MEMNIDQVLFGNEAKTRIQKGINLLADAVSVTLGPKGKNVLIFRDPADPVITKDGITVARAIHSNDLVEEAGIKAIRNVSSRVCDEAGDGTTTSCIMARTLFNEVLALIGNANPIEVNKIINEKSEEIVKSVMKEAIPLNSDDKESLRDIAMISSNGDAQLSDCLSESVNRTGKEGVISIDESNNDTTYVESIEGLSIERGFINNMFINDEARSRVVLENCNVFICRKHIKNVNEIINILDITARTKEPLLLIVDDMEPNVLSVCINNVIKGTTSMCIVKAPSIGEYRDGLCDDIAVATGFVDSSERGEIHFGLASKVIVTKELTTIIGCKGKPDVIKSHVDRIKKMLEATTDQNAKERLSKRIAGLQNGISILHIGANSEIELKEKQDRADDTIRALYSAMELGILPGGGSIPVKISGLPFLNKSKIFSENIANSALRKMLCSPLSQMANSLSLNTYKAVSDTINSKKYQGYNMVTGEIVDLVKEGIVDPCLVTVSCITNSVSIASLLSTMDCVIVKPRDMSFS